MANKIPWSSTQYNQQLDRKEEIDNLYVFGYACKIFRDAEKAEYIDRGHHLIPWMGDSGLLIDRYDGRGHLHDLRPYDSDILSSAEKQVPEEDRAIEKLIDEERYLELHTDVAEQVMYEEEELKRLNQEVSDPYSAIGFNYNYSDQQHAPPQEEIKKEDDEDMEPYEVPADLKIPKGVTLPPHVKIAAIIEKTAAFVGEHGGQMEIVIKTKQKNNSQFAFMNIENELNPFYRYLTKMIKSGKYRPQLKAKLKPSESHIEGDQHYLHPSLAKTPVEAPQSHEAFINSAVSKLPAGQIANTAYAKLLNNLSKHTGRNSPQPTSKPQTATSSLPVKASSAKVPSSYSAATGFDENGPGLVGYTDAPHPLPGIGHMPLPSPHPSQPLPPGTEPPPPGTEPTPLGTELSSQSGSASELCAESSLPAVLIDHHGHQITVPPAELQVVIDRMAQYVIKNGPDFETVVRNKNDERFDFLNPCSHHYKYYEHKKRIYLAEQQNENRNSLAAVASNPVATEDDQEASSTARAISFSLRGKDAEPAARSTYRAVLYDSDDASPELTPMERISIDYHHQSSTGMAEEKPPTPPPKIDPNKSEEEDKRQADSRLRDKLAMAAREKLAQTSKDEQIKAERKRKAAMFINMLKSSNTTLPTPTEKTEPPIIGPSLPPPGCTPIASPRASHSNSPMPTAFRTASPLPSIVNSPRSTSPAARLSPPHVSNLSRRSRSRSRSPKRKFPSRGVHSHSRRSRSRSRSRRSRSRSRRSRSRSRGSHSHSHSRRKRSRTPPSAYNIGKRSPVHKHRAIAPTYYRDRHKAHSPPHKSTSKSKSSHSSKPKKRSRSRSRSRTKKSSKSRRRSRSLTKRKSRSKSRDRKKSKHSSKSSSKRSSRSPKRKHEKDLHKGKSVSVKKDKRRRSFSSDTDSDVEVVSVNGKPHISRRVSSSSDNSSQSSVHNGNKDIHEVVDSSSDAGSSEREEKSGTRNGTIAGTN